MGLGQSRQNWVPDFLGCKDRQHNVYQAPVALKIPNILDDLKSSFTHLALSMCT